MKVAVWLLVMPIVQLYYMQYNENACGCTQVYLTSHEALTQACCMFVYADTEALVKSLR